MSYLVLARKYRPRTFADVIGQELVTGTLAGALREGRAGHAYLFTGPRGTGKTTTARIFAKALNCEQGPTPEPCGVCERCRAADSNTELDLIEIDAASHTGVDNIRDLREQANYAPLRARFKVYLIDEVHMLSKAAFNALLKTLEEPPKHVVFLFATTELHKVLGTILSRCQVLRLEPIKAEQIAARLERVFELEGIHAEPGVTAELARRSLGGMRDALSLADQLLALSGGAPKLSDLRRLAGAGEDELQELVDGLLDNRRGALLEIAAGWRGREAELVQGLLEYLRVGLIGLLCGPDSHALEGDPESQAARIARAKRIGPERMESWMGELLRARERLRQLPGLERSVLELCLLELARPDLPWSYTELLERLERLETRLAGTPPRQSAEGASLEPRPRTSLPKLANLPVARARSLEDEEADAASARELGPPAERIEPGAGAAPPSSPPRPRAGEAAPLASPAPAGDPAAAGSSRPTPAPAAAQAPAVATPRAAPPAAGPQVESAGSRPKPGHPPRAPAAAGEGRSLLQAFIEQLRGPQPSLADLLKRRARLDELGDGRYALVLRQLGAEDLRLIQSERNRSGLKRSFASLAGPASQLEIDAGAQAEERPAPPPDEPFTKEVVDLFGGRIEDRP
jgi:DNA polymerase-3 subunit gamma/tau